MTKKGRKLSTLIGITLAAGLPWAAFASPPSDASVGQIDAILNFCVKAVPSLDDGANALRKQLTSNAAPGARSSSAYKEGYEQVTEALAKGNHGQETAACVAGLKPKRDRDDHAHGRR